MSNKNLDQGYGPKDFEKGETIRAYLLYSRDGEILCKQGSVIAIDDKLRLNVTHQGRIKYGETIIAPCQRVRAQAYQFKTVTLVEKMIEDKWFESRPKSSQS